MSHVVVGVADCKWSPEPTDTLTTYALGSCIAVALHDPVARVGGLLHYMLPDSAIDPDKAERNPFLFADTGVPVLFEKVRQIGADRRRLTVRVAGGAQVLDPNGYFNIGKRNYLALRKVLWRTGLMIHAEHVGGTDSRTVTLDVATGRFTWRHPDGRQGELTAGRRAEGGN
jgi:chemotaxis protein CheD